MSEKQVNGKISSTDIGKTKLLTSSKIVQGGLFDEFHDNYV